MDIVNQLKAEHERIMNLFSEFQKDDSQEAQRVLVKGVIQELNVHEMAEKRAVWPEVRKVVDQNLLDDIEREEGELRQLLERASQNLEGELGDAIGRLRDLVQRHFQKESQQLAPQVSQKCDEATRDRLATAYLDTKKALVDQSAKLNVTMLPENVFEKSERT